MQVKQLVQPRAMKKLYALAEKRPIDLSLSENPLGCSPSVLRALKNIEIKFNDYPSPNGTTLKMKLAQKFKLDAGNFFIANGSESIINDLPRIFGKMGNEVVVPTLTFPMFAICSELAGKRVIFSKMTQELGIDLTNMAQVITPATSLIFICNPNNPTGSLLTKQNILQLIDVIPPEVLIVVDEANIEFGGESMIDEVPTRNNLLVLRTLSKGFGLASLRIGFAVASRPLIQKLEEETPLFQISGLSELLATVALDDIDFIVGTKKFVSEQRQFLKNQLENMGCTAFPSEANNLFVRMPMPIDEDQFVAELKQNGISLVMGSSFKGFDNSFFRVSVRDERTNQLFVEKMKKMCIL